MNIFFIGNDTEFIEAFMETSISYMNNNKKGISPKYGAFGQGKGKDYIEPRGNIIIINSNEGCYNCNSYMNSLIEKLKIDNFNRDMLGLDPGSNTIIDDRYFKINK